MGEHLPQFSGWQVPKYLSCQHLDGVIYLHLAIVVSFFGGDGFPDPISRIILEWPNRAVNGRNKILPKRDGKERMNWRYETHAMIKLSSEVEVLCAVLKVYWSSFLRISQNSCTPPKAPRRVSHEGFVFGSVHFLNSFSVGKKSRRRPKFSSFCLGNLLSFLMFKHTWNTHSSLHG